MLFSTKHQQAPLKIRGFYGTLWLLKKKKKKLFTINASDSLWVEWSILNSICWIIKVNISPWNENLLQSNTKSIK